MKPAVFLDRDGVLCEERGYIICKEQMKIFPFVKQAIERLHHKGYLAICITNQSAVARGMLTEVQLKEINDYLIQYVGLDALYYCPHHESGAAPYNLKCECRKPGIGMIKAAVKDWNIDLTKSYMVGDRASDILCGQAAGIKTILLETGYGTARMEQQVNPYAIYENLDVFSCEVY